MGVEETLVMIGLVHTIKGFDHQGELINLLVTYRLLIFFFLNKKEQIIRRLLLKDISENYFQNDLE